VDTLPVLGDQLREATCPACGAGATAFDGGGQPLATLAWPASAEEAQAMRRLPLDFVRCVECGHVFNAAFDYRAVPYSDKPNLMFNRAGGWSEHLREVREMILARLGEHPAVVEIGHGQGDLLRALAEARPAGRYVGFDPHGARAARIGPLEFRQALFVPGRHVAELRPDLIVSRHVLEHLSDPLGFVQSVAFAAAWAGLELDLFIEVPCVDRALATGRTVDFYYEHNSHFTTESFTRMLARCSGHVSGVRHGYDGEVIYAFAHLAGEPHHVAHAASARAFRERARGAGETIREQFDALHASGHTVAIWGGTGKSAAFMTQYAKWRRALPTRRGLGPGQSRHVRAGDRPGDPLSRLAHRAPHRCRRGPAAVACPGYRGRDAAVRDPLRDGADRIQRSTGRLPRRVAPVPGPASLRPRERLSPGVACYRRGISGFTRGGRRRRETPLSAPDTTRARGGSR
jgi:hypothetical protein